MDADELFNIVVENVLTVQEAADYLGKSRKIIWKASKSGALRHTPNGLYTKADLDEYQRNVKNGRPRKKETTEP